MTLHYLLYIQKQLVGQVVTKEKIDEAAAIYEAHLGPGLFNYDGNVANNYYNLCLLIHQRSPSICIMLCILSLCRVDVHFGEAWRKTSTED